MIAQPTPDNLRSPFPGMDPYLEMYWGDVQARMSTYISNQLRPLLPPGLVARIEQYVAVEDDEGGRYRFRPDAMVVDQPQASGGVATSVAAGTAIAPVVVERYTEPFDQRFVKIVELGNTGRIITSIEVLSVANKRSQRGIDQFMAKQQRLLSAGVNLVEIDLLRRGQWVISVPEQTVPDECRQPYRLCVVRASQQEKAEMYPATFRSPLPIVQVPLRESDANVPLDMQQLVDLSYLDGSYYATNYDMAPDPPLTGDDAEWADGLLKSQGKRSTDAS